MFSTLRAKLAIWHVAMLLVTLGVFAILLYLVLANGLQHHHDDELEQQAALVTEFLRDQDISEAAVLGALRTARVSSRFVMIRGQNGELRFREPALQTTEPNIGRHAVLTHAAMVRPAAAEFFTVDLEQSGPVRFICIPLAQADLFLQIGDPIGDVRTTLDALRDASLTLIPIVLLISSLGSWLLAKRALQPVRTLASSLREIEARDLGRRVQIEVDDQEIAALVRAVNQFLDRLQRGFENLQQFAGDVSHQLQTPLTVMKSSIEGQQRGGTGTSATLGELAQQIDAMSATVKGLRTLALADAPVPRTAFELSDAVAEGADIIAALGEMKHVQVTRDIASGLRLAGDPVRIRQVVLNLGENAVKYTPSGGRVTLTLRREGRQAVLQIADTGPGIDIAEQGRIFDRLFRGSAKAPGQEMGLGLGVGLAIAKRIVEAHAGTIDISSRPGSGAEFTVRLPLSDADAQRA